MSDLVDGDFPNGDHLAESTQELMKPDILASGKKHWWQGGHDHCWHSSRCDHGKELKDRCVHRTCCHCGREECSWLIPEGHGPYLPADNGEEVVYGWGPWRRHVREHGLPDFGL